MKKPVFYKILMALSLLLGLSGYAFSQSDTLKSPGIAPLIDIKKWGPNDTIITQAIFYQNEWMSYKELEMAWVSNLSDKKLAKFIEEWTRLRNAVYVTYPYARTAGRLMNDINAQLTNVKDKKEKREYLKTREKELKAQFADPLSDLSIYQGKILMKLINRQTSNECYDIVKNYRGGVTARLYQTVAFFFGTTLKQGWDTKDIVDAQI
jgi:hypothetical protein